MKQNKLSANYIYSMLYRASICILPLIVTPYLTRVLSAENNGLYVYTSTIACFFIMFCKLGLESYGNRSIAACRDDENARSRTFWSIYSLQLISSALSISAYLVFLTTVSGSNRQVYLLQLIYVCTGLLDISWFYYGLEQFKLTTLRSIAVRVLVIIGLFTFVKGPDDVVPYTCIMSVCFLLEQGVLFLFLHRYVRFRCVTWRDIVPHIVPNLKLFIPIMALNIYHWVDKLMLGTYCEHVDVAYYEYAESIVNLPKGLLQALGTALMPRMAYLVARHYEQNCRAMLADAMELVSIIACGACFGIIGVAPVFIPLFLGPNYHPSILLAMELAVVMIPMSLSDLIQSQYLVPFKLDTTNMLCVSLGAVMNLILNSFLIPVYGPSGAVIATLGAELIVFGFLIHKIRCISRKTLFFSLAPYISFGLVEAGIALALAKLDLPLFPLLLVQVLVAGSAYVLMSLGYFLIRRRLNAQYRNPITRMLADMKAAEQLEASPGGKEETTAC